MARKLRRRGNGGELGGGEGMRSRERVRERRKVGFRGAYGSLSGSD